MAAMLNICGYALVAVPRTDVPKAAILIDYGRASQGIID